MGRLKTTAIVLILLVPLVLTACDDIGLLLTVIETVDPPQWEKVTDFSVGTVSDGFGYAVDISANYAIIGSPGVDGLGSNRGAAFVYAKKDGKWDWENYQTLTAQTPADSDQFGITVAISDDYAVVRSFGAGEVEIFERTGDSWIWKQTFSAAGTFGAALDISGDYIAVGNPTNSYVRIYERNGTWTEDQEITQSGNYGAAVAIHNGYLAVGNDDYDGSVANSGRVFLYQKSVNWIQIDELKPDKETLSGYFGRSVSLTDDDLIISERTTMRVYFYTRDKSGWVFSQTGAIENVVVGDEFGTPVSIQGRIAVASASGTDSNRGSVYVLEKYGELWYYRGAELSHDQPVADDYFGFSSSVWGDFIIIGAYFDDTPVGANVGSVYIFTRR
jgi:hypothetical protein